MMMMKYIWYISKELYINTCSTTACMVDHDVDHGFQWFLTPSFLFRTLLYCRILSMWKPFQDFKVPVFCQAEPPARVYLKARSITLNIKTIQRCQFSEAECFNHPIVPVARQRKALLLTLPRWIGLLQLLMMLLGLLQYSHVTSYDNDKQKVCQKMSTMRMRMRRMRKMWKMWMEWPSRPIRGQYVGDQSAANPELEHKTGLQWSLIHQISAIDGSPVKSYLSFWVKKPGTWASRPRISPQRDAPPWLFQELGRLR